MEYLTPPMKEKHEALWNKIEYQNPLGQWGGRVILPDLKRDHQ